MAQLKDKNGKTEQEFLREYDVTRYFRPSVTVDAVLYLPSERGGKILLIKRGGHPYLGLFAFPGGFVDENEDCETAVARELFEETGISNVPLRQLVAASTPGRDPRWRNITVVFYATPNGEISAVGGDDASLAQWFDFTVEEKDGHVAMRFTGDEHGFTTVLKPVRDAFGDVNINNTEIIERGGMAFDHAKIVYYLYDKLREAK